MGLGQLPDDAQLMRSQDAVRDADAHHEEFSGLAFAALASGRAHSVALGINAPPLEVRGGPLRRNAGAALARKGANLVECLPRILFALQAFGSLRFGLFYRSLVCHHISQRETKSPRSVDAARA